MKSTVASIFLLSITIFAGKFYDPPDQNSPIKILRSPNPPSPGSCTDICSYLAYLEAVTNQLDCELCDSLFPKDSSNYQDCKQLCVTFEAATNTQIQMYQNYIKQDCADQSCSSGQENGSYSLQFKAAYNETLEINCRANDVWNATIKYDANYASCKMVISGILSVVFFFLIFLFFVSILGFSWFFLYK